MTEKYVDKLIQEIKAFHEKEMHHYIDSENSSDNPRQIFERTMDLLKVRLEQCRMMNQN